MARMPIANSKSIMIEGRLRAAMADALNSKGSCVQQPKATLPLGAVILSYQRAYRVAMPSTA